MKRYFEILGVGEDATLEQIQAVYEEATAGMLGELQDDAHIRVACCFFGLVLLRL